MSSAIWGISTKLALFFLQKNKKHKDDDDEEDDEEDNNEIKSDNIKQS